jgi:hypothetical protein
MLQVSPDAVVLAVCCAAASWFISVNPVMRVVIKIQAFRRLFLSPDPFLAQTKSELIGVIGITLDVEANFNSRGKNVRIDHHGDR